jgi:uncharacterized membrane protein YjfL (UPF0719 family)
MSHPHDLADLGFRVLACIGWTFLGVIVFYFGSLFFDRLDPIDYKAEIEKGNIAAAIKLGAAMLAIAAIVVAAIAT